MMLVPQVFAGMFTNNAELKQYTVWTLRVYMAGMFHWAFRDAVSRVLWHWDRQRSALLWLALES